MAELMTFPLEDSSICLGPRGLSRYHAEDLIRLTFSARQTEGIFGSLLMYKVVSCQKYRDNFFVAYVRLRMDLRVSVLTEPPFDLQKGFFIDRGRSFDKKGNRLITSLLKHPDNTDVKPQAFKLQVTYNQPILALPSSFNPPRLTDTSYQWIGSVARNPQSPTSRLKLPPQIGQQLLLLETPRANPTSGRGYLPFVSYGPKASAYLTALLYPQLSKPH